MPDFQLIAKPACSADTESQIGEYAILELPLSIVSVAAFERSEGESKLAEFLQFDAPGVSKWSAEEELSAFWSAPGQWFVTREENNSATLAGDISTALGEDAAVTDQTGGWTSFDVSGPNLVSVLEKLVGFDIAAAQNGDAQRTSIEHIGSFVLCKSPEAVRVFCPRSFARALHHALTQAIRSQLAFEAA